MLVITLATAMTVVMLIATAFALHQEAQRDNLQRKRIAADRNRF